MDRTYDLDNTGSWNEDPEWVPSPLTGLADSRDGICLPPERARTDPMLMNRNPGSRTERRTERRTSSLTFQHDRIVSEQSTAASPIYINPQQAQSFDYMQGPYGRAATMPYTSYGSFQRSPYTYANYDSPMSSSPVVSINTQPGQDVYGSYGTLTPFMDPLMTSNAGAWIDGRTSRVNSPSASLSTVGPHVMDAHELRGITNQLAITSLSQPQIHDSRIPEVAQQIPEGLHSGYRKIDKPARFFTLGRVFMMLWTEPAGRQPNPNMTVERSRFSEVILGSHAYSEIRRFVVIKPGKGHCLCSPIHTYRGRGTLKEGVNPKEHAAIYLKNKGVELLPGEKLTIEPFPLILENDKNVQIDISSRINFGKIYTVEHNVRVLNVGRIDPTSVPRLRQVFSFNPPTSAGDESEVQDSDKSGDRYSEL
ncbi:hypothetical protein ACMFMG_011475 [Clarireedia jacksonii]